MGLFSKKKEPEIDLAASDAYKKRFREIFNDAVSDGDSYTILFGYSATSKMERGFVFDAHVTTYYEYVVGYRPSDYQIVMVQMDPAQEQHSDAFYIEMNKVADVNYYAKHKQVALVYEKGYGPYAELISSPDLNTTSVMGVKNLDQHAEREAFLDFLETFRAKLEREGRKLDKWKRS